MIDSSGVPQDYDLDYDDDDDAEEGEDVDAENMYYRAKGARTSLPRNTFIHPAWEDAELTPCLVLLASPFLSPCY